MITLLFDLWSFYSQSGLLNDFFSASVCAGLIALIYRLFFVKEV